MTDNDIVKALECCTTNVASCKDCPAFVKVDRSNCKKYFRGALDLINRLQEKDETRHKVFETKCEELEIAKAEIERLKTEAKLLVENNVIAKYQICVWMGDNLILSKSEQGYDNLIKDISTKAVKEFAERLKTEYSERFLVSGDTVIEILDNLLKEMEGGASEVED